MKRAGCPQEHIAHGAGKPRPVIDEPAVVVALSRKRLVQFVYGPLHIAVNVDRGISKRRKEQGIQINVLQPKPIQFQLINNGCKPYQYVCTAPQIKLIARHNFFGGYSTSYNIATLKYAYGVSGLCQIRTTDEGIMPRPNHYYIKIHESLRDKCNV